jgi:5-methylcytosine-specific restriction endonuclease McrA
MMTPRPSVDHLSDPDLLREVTHLAACERDATARLIASLSALDARRVYLTEGFSSLFEYCTNVLRLSEHATYDRITAARAAKRFPLILEHLADGSVTLTTVRLLAPHLTDTNYVALLAEARHRSKRDVEHIIARLHPQPDVPASVRKLPTPVPPQLTTAAAATGAHADESRSLVEPQPASPLAAPRQVPPKVSLPPPSRPQVVAPIAPARYQVSLTVGAETYAKLRQAQDLLRHVVPDGDPAVIVDRALTALLTQLMKTKEAAPNRPTGRQTGSSSPAVAGERRSSSDVEARSRRIPASIQRAVWQRDGGRCTFVSRSGRRCAARCWLEFHHTVPFAAGGETSVDNLRLLCRAHNRQQAARDFGPSTAWRVRELAPAYGIDLANSCRHEFPHSASSARSASPFYEIRAP